MEVSKQQEIINLAMALIAQGRAANLTPEQTIEAFGLAAKAVAANQAALQGKKIDADRAKQLLAMGVDSPVQFFFAMSDMLAFAGLSRQAANNIMANADFKFVVAQESTKMH